jgi:plasmid stability protein
MRYHIRMGQLLVRNVPEETIAALKARAARNGRSVEAEHRAMLDALAAEQSAAEAKAAWIERARRHREELRGRSFTPSEVLMRELRDEE